MKKIPTVLFLVRAFAKLQRERSCFRPGLFRKRGGAMDDQAHLRLVVAFVLVVLLVVVLVVLDLVVPSVPKYTHKQNIEDLCEKFSNSTVFGKGLRKTAARTLLFSSGAVSEARWSNGRPGALTLGGRFRSCCSSCCCSCCS